MSILTTYHQNEEMIKNVLFGTALISKLEIIFKNLPSQLEFDGEHFLSGTARMVLFHTGPSLNAFE